jgi:hypothetical protein
MTNTTKPVTPRQWLRRQRKLRNNAKRRHPAVHQHKHKHQHPTPGMQAISLAKAVITRRTLSNQPLRERVTTIQEVFADSVTKKTNSNTRKDIGKPKPHRGSVRAHQLNGSSYRQACTNIEIQNFDKKMSLHLHLHRHLMFYVPLTPESSSHDCHARTCASRSGADLARKDAPP